MTETELEQQIKATEASLVALRRQLLGIRREEAFLFLSQISSKKLRKLLAKDKLLSSFLYDSVDDGRFACYFLELQLGGHKFKESIHTDPLLGHIDSLETATSESWWASFFGPFTKVPGKEEEKKNAPLFLLLEQLTRCKDLDDATWDRVQSALHDDVLKDTVKRKEFLSGFFVARFFFVFAQLIEDEQPFPGRPYPCSCISHYVPHEAQWVFPCLNVMT